MAAHERSVEKGEFVGDGRRVVLRRPTRADGAALWALVRRCPPLDLNSPYAYMLVGELFAHASVVAEEQDSEEQDAAAGEAPAESRPRRVVGMISGVQRAKDPTTLFVWQVAVAPEARGKGLAGRMLRHVVGWTEDSGWPVYRRIQATISPNNAASQSLFRRLATDLGTECLVSVFCDAAAFPGVDGLVGMGEGGETVSETTGEPVSDSSAGVRDGDPAAAAARSGADAAAGHDDELLFEIIVCPKGDRPG